MRGSRFALRLWFILVLVTVAKLSFDLAVRPWIDAWDSLFHLFVALELLAVSAFFYRLSQLGLFGNMMGEKSKLWSDLKGPKKPESKENG